MVRQHSLRREELLAHVGSWGHALHGCGAVTLSERPLAAESGASSLLWLEISISEAGDVAKIEALRASVGMLHELSCRAGFAAHLNGPFWVETLRQARVGGQLHDLATAIFDPNFPRYRLKFDLARGSARSEAKLVEQFLHVFSSFTGDEHSRAHSGATTRLESINLPVGVKSSVGRPTRPIQLAVSLPSMDTRWLLPMLEEYALVLRRTALDRLQLVEISLNQRRHKPKSILDGMAWLERLGNMTTFSEWIIDEIIDDAREFGQLHRRLFGLEGRSAAKIRTLHVDRPSLSDDQFAGLCSALPYTTSVTALRIYKDADWDWNVLSSEQDWAWLSYAIFHHQTASSTWKQLTLDGCGFRVEDARVVEAVRRCGGAALLNHLKTSSSFKTEAPDVHDTATEGLPVMVRVLPDATAWRLQDLVNEDPSLQPLFSVDDKLASIHFEAIGLPTALQAVVVPGIGICYIQRADTTVIKPSSSPYLKRNYLAHLTGFSARLDKWNYGSISGVKMIVHEVGPSLISLDLCAHEVLAANDVGHILASCPRLEALAINHNGTYWTDRHTARRAQFPLLHSLRVSCSLIEAYSIVCALSFVSKPAFPSLRELYFHVIKASSVFPSVAKALGAFVFENQTISDLAMVKARCSIKQDEATRRIRPDRQSKVLQAMGLRAHDLARPSHPSNARYLNRVRMAMQPLASDPSTPLPREVLTNVLSFLGAVRERQIWIDLV